VWQLRKVMMWSSLATGMTRFFLSYIIIFCLVLRLVGMTNFANKVIIKLSQIWYVLLMFVLPCWPNIQILQIISDPTSLASKNGHLCY
jgi:uncharacterized membrane protein